MRARHGRESFLVKVEVIPLILPETFSTGCASFIYILQRYANNGCFYSFCNSVLRAGFENRGFGKTEYENYHMVEA